MATSLDGGDENVYKICLESLPLGTPSHRWEDNINLIDYVLQRVCSTADCTL
jgi:hypothetical protein